MKINGHDIAESIYTDLRGRVGDLQKNGVTPQLVVLLVGNNPGSIAYVNQKEISGAKVGAKVTIKRFDESITTAELEDVIKELNEDPTVHGILLQRPLPPQVDVNKLALLTNPQKDIDGFHPDSPYTLPLPLAIIEILYEIYSSSEQSESRSMFGSLPAGRQGRLRSDNNNAFMGWLKQKNIVILGKGETGGQPIITYLKKLGLLPTIIDSKTLDPVAGLSHADIIISAVGKRGIIAPDHLKKGVILLGVGMTKGERRYLHGDYEEKDIEQIASFYTPTPKGVGPVNVAMLLDNLVTAAEKQTQP